MSDGTMIRPRPRSRQAEDAGPDQAPRARPLAGAARVLGAAVAVSLTAAGMFALLAPGQTVRGADPRSAAAEAPAVATGTVPKATGGKAGLTRGRTVRPGGAKPGAVVRRTPTAAPALPPAAKLTPAARQAALVTYLEGSGVPVSADPAKVARAARNTCTALDSGTDAHDFVADLARAAGYTAVQSTRFVTGATHFYCPRHSAEIAR